MRPDRVATSIELPNLLRREKSALADEIGRDETVGAQAARFQPVGDDRVVRGAAVVDGAHSLPAFARRASGAPRSPPFHEAVKLRFERRHRQLVTIGRGRAEATLARIRFVHVMKEQGYASHVASDVPPISNADTR